MEDQGIFKVSMFGGFDKQSVLTYVDDMIEKAQERENSLQKRCDELLSERDKYFAQVKDLQHKVDTIAESASKFSETEKDLSQKDARIKELEAQLASTKKQLSALQTHAAENEEKGRKYDSVTAQVGAVMVEAQKQADAIIARARQKADDIAQDSVNHIYAINKRLDEFKNDLYRLRSYTAETLQTFDQKIEQIDISIKEVEGHLYLDPSETPEGAQPIRYEDGAQPGSYEETRYDETPPAARYDDPSAGPIRYEEELPMQPAAAQHSDSYEVRPGTGGSAPSFFAGPYQS